MTSSEGMLDGRGALLFLERRGHLATPDLLDARLRARGGAQHRHAGWLVTLGERGWYVKQGVGEEGRRAIRHEADVLAAIADRGGDLAAHVPEVVDADDDRCVLVTAARGDSESLRGLHAREGYDRQTPAAVGRAFALVHAGPRPDAALGAKDDAPRWHRPSAGEFATMAGGVADVVGLVQSQEGFAELLDDAVSRRRASAPVHGDAKWENVVADGRDGDDGRRLTIVDWESAGFGDPLWDIGGLVAAYLSGWLLGEREPSAFLGESPSVDDAGRACAALWASYADHAGLDALRRLDAAPTVALFAGCALVDFAMASVARRPRLTTAAAAYLQAAHNLLQDPDGFAHELLFEQ